MTMEPEKAIQILQENYPKTCRMVDGKLKGGFDDLESDLGQAITAAITALQTDWFEIVVKSLRKCPCGDIWSTGDQILCKTENVADAVADLLEQLYQFQGKEVIINTGFYDPKEDKANEEEDCYTGWWYVDLV